MATNEEDRSTQLDEYSLLDMFPNDREIKVFTVLGRVLKGKILGRRNGGLLLVETQTNRQAFINLNHIVSITGEQ